MSETNVSAMPRKPNWGRKTLRAQSRKKRKAKLRVADAAKAYFSAKSKRSAEKKSAFRKKKSRKKA